MTKKQKIILGGGAAAAALAYYFLVYKKRAAAAAAVTAPTTGIQTAPAPSGSGTSLRQMVTSAPKGALKSALNPFGSYGSLGGVGDHTLSSQGYGSLGGVGARTLSSKGYGSLS